MGISSAITDSIHSVQNQQDGSGSSSRIISAIQNAAYKTGVDFSYLVKKAAQESSMDANAKASGSSATGLFQFTSQTWLHMVKQYGAQYGLGSYASQITANADGHLSVGNAVAKQAILNLRKDPTVSAEMAGELDKENAATLSKTVGGKIGGTELYMAHFLGAGGASNFISEMRSNPHAAADEILPEAASANPSVFYGKNGEAKSLVQIYQHFAQKFDSGTGTMIASAATTKPVGAAAATLAASTPTVTGIAAMPSASQVASLYNPTINIAGARGSASSGNVAANVASVQSQIASMTSAGTSAIFTAMLIGQMHSGSMTDGSAALSALDQTNGHRKTQLGSAASIAA